MANKSISTRFQPETATKEVQTNHSNHKTASFSINLSILSSLSLFLHLFLSLSLSIFQTFEYIYLKIPLAEIPKSISQSVADYILVQAPLLQLVLLPQLPHSHRSSFICLARDSRAHRAQSAAIQSQPNQQALPERIFTQTHKLLTSSSSTCVHRSG